LNRLRNIDRFSPLWKMFKKCLKNV
jgi:hypothetical protein